MPQHAPPADVPFPAAQLLMQGSTAHDLSAHDRHDGQVAAVVNVPAPVADDLEVGHPMLDEHPFALGNGLEKNVKILLVGLDERTQRGLFAVLELDGFWKLLEFKFNRV